MTDEALTSLCAKETGNPNFSLTSYDDAFALVHRAREEGWQVSIVTVDGGWNVDFRIVDQYGYSVKLHEATDPSLCRAITLAALKMWGKL